MSNQSEKDQQLFNALDDPEDEALLKSVRAAVAAGANPNALREDTPLLLELAGRRVQHLALFETLMELGADPALTDNLGRNLLHVTASRGRDLALLEALLVRGLPVDTRDEKGRTALHHVAQATAAKAVPMIELLVEKGADLRAKDEQGKEPADLARGDAMTWFSARLTPMAPNDRALLKSVAAADLEQVKTLLAARANPCVVDRSAEFHGPSHATGVCALHVAMDRKIPKEIALALLAVPKLDVNIASTEGETPLHRVIGSNRGPARRQLIERLLALGADPKRGDESGRTPFWALRSFEKLTDELELIDLLIKAGGTPATPDLAGYTLVDRMYESTERFSGVKDKPGFLKVLRRLVDLGCKTGRPDMMKWVVKWLETNEKKYGTRGKPTVAKRPKLAVDLKPLHAWFDEEAYAPVGKKLEPVAFFDWLKLEVDEENDVSEYASTLWQYHVPISLQQRVEDHELVPIGVVGMTGTLESFAEEMTDGTLFVDLTRAKAGDAPVVLIPGEDEEPVPVAASFKKFLAAIRSSEKPKRGQGKSASKSSRKRT